MDVRLVDDRAEWNAIVRQFPDPGLHQSHEWGDLRHDIGWRVVRAAVFAGGAPAGAASALVRRVPVVGTIVELPHGPLLGGHAPAEALARLLATLQSIVRPAFVRLVPGALDPPLRDAILGQRFRPLTDLWTTWNAPRARMVLPLEPDEEALLRRMTKSRRRRIARAAAAGVTVDIEAPTPDTLGRFYAVLGEHAQQHLYPVPARTYFTRLAGVFDPGDVALVLGRLHGTLVSAQLGVRFGSTAYALFAPSCAGARGTGANELVAWEFIRWARRAGCARVDFGASGTSATPHPSDLHHGIYRFKLEMGCRLQVAEPYHDRSLQTLRYAAFRAAERRVLPAVRRALAEHPRLRARLLGRPSLEPGHAAGESLSARGHDHPRVA